MGQLWNLGKSQALCGTQQVKESVENEEYSEEEFHEPTHPGQGVTGPDLYCYRGVQMVQVLRDGSLYFAICLSVIASWACSPGGKVRAPDWKRVPVSLELRLAEGSAAPGLVPAAVYGQGKTVYLHPEALLSNSDLVRVEAVKTRIGKGIILQIWLTRAGASRLKDATGRHIGDSLAVVIDTLVMAVPVIQQAIGNDPKLPIDVGVPLEPKEAQELAASVSKTWPPVKRPR